jgi:alanine dehydrogenase
LIIGVPKEIKDNEYRVSVVPSGVKELRQRGHRVMVEKNAGIGSSIPDEDFKKAGAEIVGSPEEVFKADIVIKVKEPQPEEYGYLRDGLILFTFLHLATKKGLAEALMKSNVSAIAYETVEEPGGGLPILKPMSEIAGKLALQMGAHYLIKAYGGRGVLLGGVPGVGKGRVLIIGAGTVGINAALVAVGLGADTTVIDKNPEKFKCLEGVVGVRGEKVRTLVSNAENIEKAALECDLLIGAVHVPGARTPRLVTRELVSRMKKGSVIVDVAVDQGGCVETIRPTTHTDPVFEVDGVLHYGVTNMPGVVPRTSVFALTNVTLPYLLKLADRGLKAIEADPSLKAGLNTHGGRMVNRAVAEALGAEFTAIP